MADKGASSGLSSDKPPAIFIMGPTASGKTRLACELQDRLPVELISVDSAQVYRGMDIGTAKPSPSELQRYPHRLIDICDPAEPYSAAQFRRDALREMDAISQAGRIPVLVGGTMLYFKVLLEGLVDLPGIDPSIRQRLEAEAEQLGWPELHARLAEVDPPTAALLHVNHSQRICRALEVWEGTGRPLSAWQAEQEDVLFAYQPLQVAVAPGDRRELHQRIEQRLAQMFAAGFVDEVRRLKLRGDLHVDLPSIRAVGYRQVWDFLDGQGDEALMQARALAATRQLAKRQLTWLRKWSGLHWLDSGSQAPSLLEQFFDAAGNAEFPINKLY